jgi:hypothetical protein
MTNLAPYAAVAVAAIAPMAPGNSFVPALDFPFAGASTASSHYGRLGSTVPWVFDFRGQVAASYSAFANAQTTLDSDLMAALIGNRWDLYADGE